MCPIRDTRSAREDEYAWGDLILCQGGIQHGVTSGLIAAIVGIGILAIPIFWISSQSTGFVAGLGGVVLIIVAVTAIPTAVAGGIIGALVKTRISRPGPE
jgi:hypothetical protein